MRREVFELIERVRELGIRMTPTPQNPEAIRLAGDRAAFPGRLFRVAVALEAVDRLGAATLTASDPLHDSAKLRSAIDGVFSWMKASGLDISEPHAIVAASLGVKPRTGPAPRPKPPGPKGPQTKRPSPYRLLRLVPELGEKVTLASLMARATAAQQVEVAMGPAMSRR